MSVQWVTVDELENPTHPDAQYAIEIASWILYKLTGEKYPGISESVEWYGLEHSTCNTGCYSYASSSPLESWARPHHHYFLDSFSVGASQLRLKHTPALSVTSVVEDGSTLDPSAYRLGNYAYLTRIGACWNLARGIEVSYRHGQNPPTAGRRAAAMLANQFILAFMGSDECRLPDRVTSISRQGVSYTIMDPQEFMKDGRTGLYEVDLFIRAANPAGAKRRPRVFSPDRPRGEHRS